MDKEEIINDPEYMDKFGGFSEVQANLGGIRTCSDLDFSTFGIPFPYQLQQQAQDLTARMEKGEVITDAQLRGLQNYTESKIKMKHLSELDPVQYGWKLKSWELVEKYWNKAQTLLIMGGQRSSKSLFMGRVVANLMKQKAEAKIRCLHETETRSIEDQQTFVYNALPMEINGIPIKDALKMKGTNFSMGYKQSSGFTKGRLVIPPLFPYQARGSEVIFNNYQQWVNKNNVFEGMEADLIWGDEQMPFKLYETLLSRLPTRKGKLVLTFTPIDGFTELVQDILGDARIVETRYSDILGEELPIVLKSRKRPDTYIIYFWTQDNPFSNFEALRKIAEPQGRDVMVTKLFGIPEKKSQTKFPLFNPSVHVISNVDIPTEGVTRYHIMDPAGEKNYAMIWGAIDNANNLYVYREWPNMKLSKYMNKLKGKYNGLGEWALPGQEGSSNRNKGMAGPAQKTLGLGFDGYAQLISDMENGDEPIKRQKDDDGPVREVIFERLIDPRFAQKGVTQDDGTKTMIQSFQKHGLYFRPAKTGKDIDVGLMAINSLLFYDTSRPVDDRLKAGGNHPRLYIAQHCHNLISCIQNYTGLGGQEEYAKDFIDLLRYWILSSPVHIGKDFKRYVGSGQAVY